MSYIHEKSSTIHLFTSSILCISRNHFCSFGFRNSFLPRYDFILIICVIAQIGMLVSKLETFDEFKVICLFHIIGLALELYKVHMGSWSYPEEAYSKIMGVPLYSGFMYASVASYICQSWLRMKLQIINWPKSIYAILISSLIYLNFFTHHYLYDARWVLTVLLLVIFFRTAVTNQIFEQRFELPPLSTLRSD